MLQTGYPWSQSHCHLNLDWPVPSPRRKGHSDLSGDQLDLMQGWRAAQGSEHSTLVPLVAQALVQPFIPTGGSKETSAIKELPAQRRSPDAPLSAGVRCVRWIIAKEYLGGNFAGGCKHAAPPGHSLCAPEERGVAGLGQKRGGLGGNSRPPLLSQLPHEVLPGSPPGAAPARQTGREEGGAGAGKKGLRGKFQGVCRGGGRILMSQRSGLSVTSLLPEKRRPGAGGRSVCSSRSGRSEPPAACAGQDVGQSSGMARSLGAGVARGGRARARKAPGRGADLSSPPPPPSRSPVPASARDAAQHAFRLQVAPQRHLGRTAGGRGWSSAPAGIRGSEGARAQNRGEARERREGPPEPPQPLGPCAPTQVAGESGDPTCCASAAAWGWLLRAS